MADPLDYFNPRTKDERVPNEPAPADRRRDPLAAAVPMEFDELLTRSDDHAAVRAVEAELRRHQVPFFRTEGAGVTRRGVELHVRSADRVRASQLAAMIFARRKRLHQASPRRKPPSNDDLTERTLGLPMMPGGL